MSDHLSPERLESYRARTLAPDDLLAADGHVLACETCRDRVANAGLLEPRFDSAREALAFETTALRHLDYDEIARFIDDTGDQVDREIAESHLALCERCAAEVQDLRSLKLASGTDRRGALGRNTALPWRTSTRWRSVAAWKVPLQIAVATALLLAIGWTTIRPLRSEIDRLDARVADLERENTALRQRVASSAERPGAATEARPALVDAGGRITIDGEGRIAGLAGLAAPEQEMVRLAFATGRVEMPSWLGEMRGTPGVLMGEQEPGIPFALIGPVGIAVETTRPTLRWHPLSGATHYRVVVLDAGLNRAAASPILTAAEWTPPAPLRRGQTYSWQVIAIRDGEEIASPAPPAPEARFRVVAERDAAQLEELRRTYAGSRLLLGLSYARAGLLDRAVAELEELVKANPQSPIVRQLLQSLQERR